MDTALRTPSTSIERVETAHKLLTIKEAAAEMRICLSHAYELAHEYLNSGGTTGLPSTIERGADVGPGEPFLRVAGTFQRMENHLPYFVAWQ